MRKISLLIIVMVILVTIAGCNKDKNNVENNGEDVTPTTQPLVTLPPEELPGEEIGESVGEEDVLTLEDYFPLEADTEYIYEGTGNEYASYRRYIDYIDMENKRIQTRTNNGGTETVRVIQIKDGAISVIYLANESYYRADYMNMEADSDAEVLLMEPLKKGTTWQLSDGRKRYISEEKVTVNTPYGDFDAIEVTTESDDSTTKDYYAAGIGLVKSLFQSDSLEVSSTLSALNKNAILTQSLTIYYPDADEKIYGTQAELKMATGTEVLPELEKIMRTEPPKDTYLPLLSKNTKINSLDLEENNILHVDFSPEFVTEMNAGAGYELLILQSVTNTLGNYYGTSQVLITLEGKPYESGHILMNEGELFEVNMENVAQ